MMYMVNDETIHDSGGFVEGFSTPGMLGTCTCCIFFISRCFAVSSLKAKSSMLWRCACVCVNHHARKSLQGLCTTLSSSFTLAKIVYSFNFCNPVLPIIKSYCVTYLGLVACLHLSFFNIKLSL
jgi:hypothetical protein